MDGQGLTGSVVGDSSGKVIVKNRLTGPAPSIALGSRSQRGIDCRPAKKTTAVTASCSGNPNI